MMVIHLGSPWPTTIAATGEDAPWIPGWRQGVDVSLAEASKPTARLQGGGR